MKHKNDSILQKMQKHLKMEEKKDNKQGNTTSLNAKAGQPTIVRLGSESHTDKPAPKTQPLVETSAPLAPTQQNTQRSTEIASKLSTITPPIVGTAPQYKAPLNASSGGERTSPLQNEYVDIRELKLKRRRELERMEQEKSECPTAPSPEPTPPPTPRQFLSVDQILAKRGLAPSTAPVAPIVPAKEPKPSETEAPIVIKLNRDKKKPTPKPKKPSTKKKLDADLLMKKKAKKLNDLI